MAAILPGEAVARLRALILPKPENAVEELYRVGALLEPMPVFREMYPAEYAECAAAAGPKAKKLRDATMRFIQLIERDHFPMSDFMEVHIDEGISGFPVAGFLSYEWWNDDVASASSAMRFGCCLVAVRAMGDADDIWPTLGWPKGGPEWLDRVFHVDTHVLRDICRRERGPARAFLPSLQILEHMTGNIWIDITTDSDLECVPWDRRRIVALGREWRAAQKIWERVNALSTWIDQDPAAHTRRLLRLWARAAGLDGKVDI